MEIRATGKHKGRGRTHQEAISPTHNVHYLVVVSCYELEIGDISPNGHIVQASRAVGVICWRKDPSRDYGSWAAVSPADVEGIFEGGVAHWQSDHLVGSSCSPSGDKW